MISRRIFSLGVAASSILLARGTVAETANQGQFELNQLDYPSFARLYQHPFGYNPATDKEQQTATQIINSTISGPTPADVAQSFVDRFYIDSPRLISQWPKPDHWNPLVVAFFGVTKNPPNNDMTPWCAAFANWCIERSGRIGSKSSSSQSFLTLPAFPKVDAPQIGDLAVFTCYKPNSSDSLGIGHVGFVKELPASGIVKILGGNQSLDGHSSIISEKYYPTGNVDRTRRINNIGVDCTQRLNSYFRIV